VIKNAGAFYAHRLQDNESELRNALS